MSEVDKKKYYGSSAWIKLRDTHLMAHPYCINCYSRGLDKRTDLEVHHVIKWADQPDDLRDETFSDADNLITLCSDCHKALHAGNIRITPQMT